MGISHNEGILDPPHWHFWQELQLEGRSGIQRHAETHNSVDTLRFRSLSLLHLNIFTPNINNDDDDDDKNVLSSY